MQALRYILQNITVLNIILMAILLTLGYTTVLPLVDMDIQLALKTPKKIETEEAPSNEPAQTPMLTDYMIIAEQNLFHPERKIPEKKEEKQLPKPEFVLYGTLITEEASIAYMEDMKAPHNTAGRGKRQKAIQKGSMFSGFILSEVHHEKVVMVRADERIEVRVTDQQNKKQRTTETTSSLTAHKDSGTPQEAITEPAPRGRVQATISGSPTERRRPSEDRKRQIEDIRRNIPNLPKQGE